MNPTPPSTPIIDESAPNGSADPARPGPVSFLLLSAWCGLVAGLLEVATIVLRKRFYLDTNQLYLMSHHFVWLVPATNLCLFVVLGGLFGVAVPVWSRREARLVRRVLCALTLLPMAMVAFPQIYGLGLFLVAMGLASWLVPWLDRRARTFRRVVRITFPAIVALVLALAAWPWVSDRLARSRERARALPPSGSPNVLLIVMDTVAADHLGLHGYERPTSTSLGELAGRGIRFASAQAPSSWTLPSHAAMFTGRWLHELSVGWLTPLDGACPTLAEYLGARGYATAGFVANTPYCARDSGLNRGFTEYRDYIFPGLTAFKKTVLVSRAVAGIDAFFTVLEEQFGATRMRNLIRELPGWIEEDRKPAAVVNRELLGWLSGRSQPERPFFAFLNYFDAHYPYLLPPGRYHRFGGAPTDSGERALLERWGTLDKRPLSPQDVALGVRAYDDCVADLDEQIGRLTDRLRRTGVLDRTWLILVADHGESFGEHPDIFAHGTSLYQTEVHVPLVIVPPGGLATGQVMAESVSTRDLAATIVALTGQAAGSPFPGRSLSRFWERSGPATPPGAGSDEAVLAELVPEPNAPHNMDAAGRPKTRWPLGSIQDEEWSYIRQEGDVREELFRLREDAKQRRNLAGAPAARPALERMRAALGRITAGPLLPRRFNP